MQIKFIKIETDFFLKRLFFLNANCCKKIYAFEGVSSILQIQYFKSYKLVFAKCPLMGSFPLFSCALMRAKDRENGASLERSIWHLMLWVVYVYLCNGRKSMVLVMLTKVSILT